MKRKETTTSIPSSSSRDGKTTGKVVGVPKFKHLRKTMQETRQNLLEASESNVNAEVLLPASRGLIEIEAGSNEKTYKLKQKDLRNDGLVDMNTLKNLYDFQLRFGPYKVNYSRNGRYMLLGGFRGHVAIMDCLRTKVDTELQLQQEVHDIHYLHNETMFAAAQKKYIYIYDYKGVEIHCMKRHENPYCLDFLPYHFLLTSVGHSGWIKWHDISIGEYVAGYSTGFGPAKVLKHNPSNGVSHVGHSNGVVTLWSPAAGKPLASMFCHKSPVNDIAIDREGRYLASAGMDGKVKIWDLRKYTQLYCFQPEHPATCLDISATGLLAMGIGRTVQILKDAYSKPAEALYMTHKVRTPDAKLAGGGGATARAQCLASAVLVSDVTFRPLEDSLCIGHSHGVSSIIVPGAGEANFDSFEANPFISQKQRREEEVQSLLGKLSPDMIGLDASFVGSVDQNADIVNEEQRQIFYEANKKTLPKKEKNRMRGKNKISAKLRRKQKNVVDEQTEKLKEQLIKQKEARALSLAGTDATPKDLGALRRFY